MWEDRASITFTAPLQNIRRHIGVRDAGIVMAEKLLLRGHRCGEKEKNDL